MGRLVYGALCSLDGYTVDAEGSFAWAQPDAEVHAYVNDLERPTGTYLYGRRMYETMAVWQTLDEPEPEMRDYASIWRAADKVVFSRTLEAVSTPRTRLEPEFDVVAVSALVHDAERDVSIGGPHLAARALGAEIVDDVWLVVFPVVVGGGMRALPDGLRADLELTGQRRFDCGAVAVHYRLR